MVEKQKVEVESEANNSDASKRILFLVFLALGALIVVLIITIAVVIVKNHDRNVEVVEQNINELENVEATSIYTNDVGDIAKTIVEQESDDVDVLKLYEEKISSTDDLVAKALLENDYYAIMASTYGVDNSSKKEEVLNGLKRTDDILQTYDSAMSMANVAFYYDDYELCKTYINIAKERDSEAFKNDSLLEELIDEVSQ